MGRWTALIDDLVAGRWVSPLTGKRAPPVPFGKLVIEEDLTGHEARCVLDTGLEPPFVVVSDANTHKAMGERVARALRAHGGVHEIVLDTPRCDMATIDSLGAQIGQDRFVVAVGSGTINDLCKFATFRQGRPYAVFGTAASMNGYASSTASVSQENGLKVSLPAQMPRGLFIDLAVCAAGPGYLAAAGFGDSLCRTVAQIDWWMSHRLLGTPYQWEPYVIEIPDEIRMLDCATGIARGDIEAVGTLMRVMILCGIGVSFTGVSNHGSMGEHQISHYLDCFAGTDHPGTVHGAQVGVASLTMARIQGHFLSREAPPVLNPTRFDRADMARRMGRDVARDCHQAIQGKALDADRCEALNARLAEIWPELRRECLDIHVPAETLAGYLRKAGGPTTASELGFPAPLYREAVCHAHEMRDRFSFTDIAACCGELEALARAETQGASASTAAP